MLNKDNGTRIYILTMLLVYILLFHSHKWTVRGNCHTPETHTDHYQVKDCAFGIPFLTQCLIHSAVQVPISNDLKFIDMAYNGIAY